MKRSAQKMLSVILALSMILSSMSVAFATEDAGETITISEGETLTVQDGEVTITDNSDDASSDETAEDSSDAETEDTEPEDTTEGEGGADDVDAPAEESDDESEEAADDRDITDTEDDTTSEGEENTEESTEEKATEGDAAEETPADDSASEEEFSELFNAIEEVAVISDEELEEQADDGTAAKTVTMNGASYDSLQEALKAATEVGDYTILLSGTIDEVTDFKQAKGVNITIDGQNLTTYTGTIEFHGDAMEDGKLTIQNIAFETEKTSHDFIKSVNTNYYPSDVLIQDCSFEGPGGDNAVVAVRIKSSKNVEMKNCTGKGLHSFLQNTAGWNLTIDNVDITDSLSGFALGTVQGVTVKNCDINVAESGIRIDAEYDNKAIIEDCNVTAFIPVVVRKAKVESNITFNGKSTMTQTNTDGLWCAIGTSEYKENGSLPTDATGNVHVTLNDTSLDASGVYGEYVVPPKGTVAIAYTGKDDNGNVHIWGEGGTANAKESYVLKVFSGDELVATTQLNNIGGIIDGDVYVTWHFFYPESNDDYWTTTWEEGHPNSAAQPDKIVLYVDGVEVAENVVQMNGPDNLNRVTWEELGGVEYIVTGLKGEGTEDKPYLINNIDELKWFRDDVNRFAQDGSSQYEGKYIKLTADIDLDEDGDGFGEEWEPIGSTTVDHGSFYGTFDGDGHTISNLVVSEHGAGSGFFAKVSGGGDGPRATVKNINFHNVDVSSGITTNHSGSYVGGVIANAGGNSVISNVHVTGNVYVDGYGYVGAIVGHGYPKMYNCSVVAEDGSYVNAYYWCAGALVGYAGEGGTVIEDCSVSGIDVWSAYGAAGAAVGLLQTGNKLTNVSASNVEVTSASDYCMGYVAGNGEESTLTNITVSNVTATANGKPITATDVIAFVGDAFFFDLASAIEAAKNGGTVVLNRDVVPATAITVPEGAVVTLDLNGKTLNGYILAPNADLTVKNGAIVNTNIAKSGIEINAGELTLTDVDIDSSRHAVRIDGEVTATINGGTYRSAIGGGTVTLHAVNASGGANVVIEDGTFVGPKGTTADSGAAVCVQADTTVTIYGGSFSGGKNITLLTKETATLTLYGGTYDMDPSAYCAPSYSAVENADGIFEVSLANKVWLRNANGTMAWYSNLQSAVNAADAGATLTLLCDITLSEQVVIDKSVTLDLNGCKVTTGGVEESRVIVLGEGCTEFVINANGGSIISTDAKAYGIVDVNTAADVTINGGTYDFDTDNGGLFKFRNYESSITLNDVTVETNNQVSGPNFLGNVLDVNGGTFSSNNSNLAANTNQFYIANGAVATFDDVTIDNDYVGGIEAYNSEVTVNNCNITINGTRPAPYLSMAVSVSGGGKATINGGTYATEPLAAADANGQGTSHGSWTGGVMSSGGTMIINGGTFSNGNYGDDALATNPREILILGADTKYGSNVVGEIQINGGTFSGIGDVIHCETIWDQDGDGSDTAATKIIATDGNFTACDVFVGGCNPVDTGNPVEVKISGGIYSATSELDASYMAEGYEIVANDDGTYGVAQIVYVASVTDADGNVSYYKDLVSAFKAATDNCTIEILDDVVIDYKWDCRDYATNGSHSQFKESVTINGNDKTIKFTGEINDSNWNTIFRFEENATVNDLTIDISEATGAQRVITAKKSLNVDNLTIVGSAKYGIIFGEGASAEDLANAEISISNSDLSGTRRAISDNEGGKDVKSVTITGNTLNANAYVSAFETVTFTGNTMADGYADIRSYTADNALNVTATGNTLKENTETQYNYIKAGGVVNAQEGFILPSVAKITDKSGRIEETYTTIEEALANLYEGDTLTLLSDATISESINVKADLTINGNGHTLTYTGSGASARAITVESGVDADLTIKNLTVDCTASYCQRGINYNTDGALTLDNVTVKGENVTYALNLPGNSDGAEVTITNSSFTGNIALNVWGENTVITATDSSFTSVDNATHENYTAVKLNSDGAMSAEGAVINIVGGSITALDQNGEHSSATGNSTITGVINVSDTTVVTGNHIETVAIIDYGTTEFYGCTTLQAAINKAAEDTTGKAVVKLIRDITLAESVNVANGQTVVIDLNGKTITGTDNATGSFGLINNRGNLTVKDSSEDKTGKITLTATNDRDIKNYSSVISNNPGGKLVVEGGTIEHLGGTYMAYGIDNLTNGKGTYAETEINGGTIKSTYRAIRQFLNGVEAQNILTVNGGTIEGANKSIWVQGPSTKANSGTITVAKDATLKGDVYISAIEGTTEYPVTVSIAAAALAEDSNVIGSNLKDAGLEIEENNGVYGLVALPPELPTATVEDITTQATDPDLTFALNFAADEATDAQLAYYGDWYADFVLTVSGLTEESVTFNANSDTADGYLAGQYDEWSKNWVSVPFENVTLTNGESIRIMEYAAELMNKQGLKFTYAEVYDIVKDFNCGVYFTPEFLEANPDIEVTLDLRMYNGDDDEEGVAIGETYEFTAPVLPNAEVKELGAITVDEYKIYNGSSLIAGGDPIDLQVAMEFIAKDTVEQAQANYYGNFTTDFFLEFNGMAGESFVADGCYLAGNYGTFGWIMIPLDGMVVEEGKVYPVISSVGLDFSYIDICDSVKDFKCGIYFSEEVIKANPDMTATLSLGLSKNINEAKEASFTEVDAYDYDVIDMLPEVELFRIEFDNMVLGNALDMMFAFAKDNVEDWTGHYVEVVKEYADGRPDVKQIIEMSDWESTSISGKGYYYVTFAGVAAKEMTDDVIVTVYDADGNAVSETFTDSVRDYVVRTLKTATGEKRTMLIDMLNYGTAAQNKFSYGKDNLANAGMDDYQEYATQSVTVERNASFDSTYCYARQLVLENSIKYQMALKPAAANVTKVVVTYNDHYGKAQTLTINASDFEKNGNYYVLTIDTLVVADGRQVFTGDIYVGDEVVGTFQDSIESLAYDNNTNELFTSIMKFSDSAYAFFH